MYIRVNPIWIGWCNKFKENPDDQQKHRSTYKRNQDFLKKYWEDDIFDEPCHTQLGSWI